MKALVTDSTITRAIVWVSLTVTSLMLDLRFSRIGADIAAVLLSLAYFIIGNGDSPGYTVFKLGYLGFTVLMGTPWTVSTVTFELLHEAERLIRGKRGEGK